MVALDNNEDSSNYTISNQKSSAAVFVGHHLDNTTTLPNSFSHMIEMGECKKKALMPEKSCTITNTWSLKKFMNSQGEKRIEPGVEERPALRYIW
jgi:hypothetical protein